MANFETNKGYTNEIRQFETTDKVHADVLNEVVEKLVNNDVFLKEDTTAGMDELNAVKANKDLSNVTDSDFLSKSGTVNIKAVDSKPNFSETDVTTASLGQNIASVAPALGVNWVLSSGSGVTGTYKHTSGSTAILSFPMTISNDRLYEITFTQTETNTTDNFNLYFSAGANHAYGQTIQADINYNTTFVVQAANDYSYLNVVPKSGWNGNFTLTGIKMFTTHNSESLSVKGISTVQKGSNYIVGGGGKTITTGTNNTANGYKALYSDTTGSDNTANGNGALTSNTTGCGNTASGNYSLNENTFGSNNTANGNYALCKNKIGYENTAVGYLALRNNIAGNNNTATGSTALFQNTTGNNNVATGRGTLQNNTTGSDNTAAGRSALSNNITGVGNTASGSCALYGNKTGNANSASGDAALFSNISGNDNTASGHFALYNNNGSGNTAAGSYALFHNTTGRENTADGELALYKNTTGNGNTASGFYALNANTTGGGNTAGGYRALTNNTSGSYNAALGSDAGTYLANGLSQTAANHSIFIGANSRGSAADNQINQIVIGNGACGDGSNTVHIGNGQITTATFGSGTSTTFANQSDPRIKEDIKPADIGICYEDIKSLPLYRFKYKDFVGNPGDKHLTGFLSTEFAKVLPKAVHKRNASFDAVDENGDIVYETKTIEEIVLETEETTEPNTGMTASVRKEVKKQIEKQVPKQIVIEDCESIDTSQLAPTLLGAVQMLMQKVEDLENKLAEVN